MRRAVTVVAIFIALLALSLVLSACDEVDNRKAEEQRQQSVEARAGMFARAEAKIPIPRTENFPLREVLAEYTRRHDMLNHPWYTDIMRDDGLVTHYFVSTTVPVNSCAFLSSTEDVHYSSYGNLKMTAPSLDGIYYGGSGAASACNGWIFIDAATGSMGMAFGTNILTFDSPLILETEPVLLKLVPNK